MIRPLQRALLIIALLVCTNLVHAQFRHFIVTHLKGKAEVKSRKKWIDLKVSDKLQFNDEIRLDRNATMHLSDSAGQPILFTLPGIYKIGDFIKMNSEISLLDGSKQVVIGKTARVKQNFFESNAPIKVLLPVDSTFATVYSKQFIIRWIDQENKGPYLIFVKNLLKETIATLEVEGQDTLFHLNTEQLLKDTEPLLKQRVLYFVIASKADPKYKSAEHVIKRISIHERYRIDDVLNKEIILDNSRALDQLVLAGFYEEHALFVDAVNAYLESIRLGKDDPVYTEAFIIFLQRYGLDLLK
jgi:hypothetical protein